MAKRRHRTGHKTRWFADSDAAAFNLKHRHTRMVLVDLVAIMQRCAPYGMLVNFDENLGDLFRSLGQSMVVACSVLRDDLMWQVLF